MATPALEALHAIQAAMATNGAEAVPPGWLTVDEWAAAWGKSRARTDVTLKAGARLNIMECRKFRIATGYGVRDVRHYRQKP